MFFFLLPGSPGAKGDNGLPGGASKVPGPPGSAGAKGDRGPAGRPGKSALRNPKQNSEYLG